MPDPAPARTTPAEPRARAARLDPEVRKDLILEKAAELVLANGISNCSLEAVAQAAGVSKALVYKYFPNRDALLSKLLQREFDYMLRREAVYGPTSGETLEAETRPIEEILRAGVYGYLEYLHERGGLFRMLVTDANVASQAKEVLVAGRGANMRYWTDRTMAAYGLPYDLARIGVIMTSFALEGAQGSIRAGRVDMERLADFWTVFVRGGWAAAGKKFGAVDLDEPA